MARARVVTPPPKDYIPEPLVATPPPSEIVEEQEWIEGNMEEEIIEVELNEPSQEELDREKIAQEKHEELQRQKLAVEEESKVAAETIAKAKEIVENPPVKIETVIETIVETVHVTDPKLVEELDLLRAANEKLVRENEAAAKAKEEQILKVRKQATDQKSSQLNMVEARKPSLVSKIKSFLKRRRIKSATNPLHTNYEFAIIQQASVAVPKMLDDMEKMHENLVILEELLVKYKERQKITESEKRPRH
jgi:hypothetical protein